MLTALDASPESLDDVEQSFVAKIREYGWFRTSVSGDGSGPGFSYTTGFWVDCGQPEFVVFSLKNEIAHNVFWDLFRDGRDGQTVPIGRRSDAIFGNAAAYAFRVAKTHYQDHFGWSRWFYGNDDFACLQIVWPDRAGKFPWEVDFDEAFGADQPDLTERGWINEVLD